MRALILALALALPISVGCAALVPIAETIATVLPAIYQVIRTVSDVAGSDPDVAKAVAKAFDAAKLVEAAAKTAKAKDDAQFADAVKDARRALLDLLELAEPFGVHVDKGLDGAVQRDGDVVTVGDPDKLFEELEP